MFLLLLWCILEHQIKVLVNEQFRGVENRMVTPCDAAFWCRVSELASAHLSSSSRTCSARSPRTLSPRPGRPGGSLGKRGHIEPCLPPWRPEGPGGGAAPRVLSSSSPPITRSLPGLSAESPLPSPSTQRSPPGLSPLGPASQGLSPLLGPVLSDAAGAGMDNREEPRRKVGAPGGLAAGKWGRGGRVPQS